MVAPFTFIGVDSVDWNRSGFAELGTRVFHAIKAESGTPLRHGPWRDCHRCDLPYCEHERWGRYNNGHEVTPDAEFRTCTTCGRPL